MKSRGFLSALFTFFLAEAFCWATTVKVVTYNIHEGLEYSQILENLKYMDADIIALQEVDTRFASHGGRDTARALAKALDMQVAYGRQMTEPDKGEKGQAVLSRFQVTGKKVIELPAIYDWTKHGRKGSRICLRADLLIDGSPVSVYNAHLENRDYKYGKGRKRQLAVIAQDIAKQPASSVILLGDLNTFYPGEPRSMRDLIKKGGFQSVFPANARTMCVRDQFCLTLDWIFIKGPSVLEGKILPLRGSDHYPLLAEIQLP